MDEDHTPSAEDLDASGVRTCQDAALLHEVRDRIIRLAALTDGDPGDVLPGAIVPAGPSGGLAGVALTVAITALKRLPAS